MDCFNYFMFLQDSNAWDSSSSYSTYPDDMLVRCSKYASGDGGLNAQYRVCSMFEDTPGSCTGVNTNTAPFNAEPYSRLFSVLNGISSTDPSNTTVGHQLWTELRRPTTEELNDMHLLGIQQLPWNYSPWVRVNMFNSNEVIPMNVLHPENLVNNGKTAAKLVGGGIAGVFAFISVLEISIALLEAII